MFIRRIVLLVAVLFAIAAIPAASTVAQQDGPTWQANVFWYPSLEESGIALAELVNQIDASCSVDVDPVVAANGSGPEGAVYAFAVTWRCPAGIAETPENTWQSAMLWQPTLADAGNALAELVNQIDAACSVDVDPVVATNGSGPEGPVYAFVATWAC